jgi:hypothetical protein
MFVERRLTQELYTPKEVQVVRELLLKEQDGKCKITGQEIPTKQAVLDHTHDKSQVVRAVLHRQVNAFVGKVENAYIRLIAWWYPGTLSQLLRQVADYLELPTDSRYIHPGWIKKVQTEFNKLSESAKDDVLTNLELSKGKNSKERKEIFRKAVLSRKFTYKNLLNQINKE